MKRSNNPGTGPGSPTPGIALPVAASGKIRPSRAGRRRAAVLLGIHVLIAIHIGLWYWQGSTLSPLEPSEAMEFSKRGIVNAGLIFFGLTIASTLLLGRWFCGWACHLVALQDLARWMLHKIGIKPKPFRAGILAVVPLVAFLYMFIAPLIYRALQPDQIVTASVHLTTEHFWETFPPWIPALLTFAICGFVIVYFLGSKSFCSFGCPYGAIFGIADQLAPVRIRVTDDCKQSGHCTAVCSSNVRVHQEVRDFGMVVDPGCMKCNDCVSVCPNDALYVGVGRPALLARKRSTDKARSRSDENAIASALRWLLTGTFVAASFTVLSAFDSQFAGRKLDWQVVGILAGLAIVLLAVFADRSSRKQDYSITEQTLLAAFFLLAIAAFRGLYGAVGLLFALGIAVLAAYAALQAVMLVTRDQLSVHGRRLKQAKRWTRAGYAYCSAFAFFGIFWLHSGVIQYSAAAARRAEDALVAMRPASPADRLTDAEVRQVSYAERHARRVERWGLFEDPGNIWTLAQCAFLNGRVDEFEQRMTSLLLQWPDDTAQCLEWASYLVSAQRFEDAIGVYRGHLDLKPRAASAYQQLGMLLTMLGRAPDARELYLGALSHLPNDSTILRSLGLVEVRLGDLPAAAERFAEAVTADPGSIDARIALGGALFELGRGEEGQSHYLEAIRLDSQRPDAYFHLGSSLGRNGQLVAAQHYLEAALERSSDSPDVHTTLAQVLELRGEPAAAARHRAEAARIIESRSSAGP